MLVEAEATPSQNDNEKDSNQVGDTDRDVARAVDSLRLEE